MASQLISSHRTCTWRCRSQQHASQIASAVTKSSSAISNEQLKAYLVLTCSNVTRSKDQGGRTLVHWAASCTGRTEVMEWLLDELNAEIDAKDYESGYTPLYRALLHGQLASAQALIDRGAALQLFDHEGLTPLDIVWRDQEAGGFTISGPTEVYSCGENATSNLGHRVPTERVVPDLVDFFSHRALSVKKVAMSKWHTAFLTVDGSVYTCGRGSFGRLGQCDTNDRTVPSRVMILGDTCVEVAVGEEHTVVVTEHGAAWGWGDNRRCQLGVAESFASIQSPQLISLGKTVKDQTFRGCACGDLYTILWTGEAVYACGANDGQFGQCALKSESSVFPLRPLVAVAAPFLGADLLDIACGATALAILTKAKRDVFLLQNYECRRVFGRDADFSRLIMNVSVPKKSDHSSQPTQHPSQSLVRLTMFTERGAVYYWDSKDRSLRRCIFTGVVARMIYPLSGCSFGNDGIFLVTPNGQLYKGRIEDFGRTSGSTCNVTTDASSSKAPSSSTKSEKRPSGKVSTDDTTGNVENERNTQRKYSSTPRPAAKASVARETSAYFAYRETGEFLDPAECQTVSLSARIQAVHRAIAVCAASDGRNFCVIQQNPKSALTELPTETDSTMMEDFRMLLDEADQTDCLHDLQIRTSENGAQFRAVHKFIICSRCPYFSKRLRPSSTQLEMDEPAHVVTESALDRILHYIYTDDCDLFHIGPVSVVGDHSLRKSVKERDPVRELAEAAKRLNMKSLVKRLECVRWDSYTNTITQSTRYRPGPAPLRFEPTSFPELCDVILHCKDTVCLPTHRCILSARSEYFRCMFASGWWSETRRHQTLNVDVESAVLQPVLHYLYTDELPAQAVLSGKDTVEGSYTIADKDALEYYGKILVCADQWLLDRLRRLCEVEMAARITLRNVSDMLEFAHAVNADKLFASCSQFISLNLCSLLESNAFRNSSPDCLHRVGEYYRNFYPCVGHRTVAPSTDPPSVQDIETVWNDVVASDVSAEDIVQEFITEWTQSQVVGDSPTASAKKKRTGARTTPRARRTSASSDTTGGPENKPMVPDVGEGTKRVPLADIKETNAIPAIEKASMGKIETGRAWLETISVVPKKVASSQPIAVPSAGSIVSRSRNKPWNVALSPEESISEVSLRDLMQAEQKKHAAVVAERRKSSEVVNLFRMDVSPKDYTTSPGAWASTSPPAFATSARFGSSLVAYPPLVQPSAGTPNRAFNEIMNEEKSKEATRTRLLNKPLKLIQAEELAMQELSLIYQIDDNWDELITVERASTNVAEPTWQAHIGSPH